VCPTGATISPDSEPFKVGDVLTCNADGYNPTYTWSGVFNGIPIVTHTGSTYTLLEGDFQLICTATDSQSICPAVTVDIEGSAFPEPGRKY